jgi:Domain of unknown function (DUF4340)
VSLWRLGFWYLVAALLAFEYWRVSTVAVPATAANGRAQRPRLLAISRDDVRTVRLVHGGRVLVLSRREDGWQVQEPAEASITSGLVEAFVAALLGAEVVDQPGAVGDDPGQYGLDERAIRIEVQATAAPGEILLLGTPNPSGTAVYVRRGGGAEILLVGRNLAYYEELLFQALPPGQVPAGTTGPVGG